MFQSLCCTSSTAYNKRKVRVLACIVTVLSVYVAHSSFWHLRSTKSCQPFFRCCYSALQPLKPAQDHHTHSSADAGASSRSDGEGRPCQCKYRIRKKLEPTHGGIMSHSVGRAAYGSAHNSNVYHAAIILQMPMMCAIA